MLLLCTMATEILEVEEPVVASEQKIENSLDIHTNIVLGI